MINLDALEEYAHNALSDRDSTRWSLANDVIRLVGETRRLRAAITHVTSDAIFNDDPECFSDEGHAEWGRYVYPHREAVVQKHLLAALENP